MNTFRTAIPPSNFPFKITHNHSIMCIGSCFTENIGRFLAQSKFQSLINPFGIIYNPVSICKLLRQALDNTPVLASDLVSINDRFYHWDFHGDLSRTAPNETVKLLNGQILKAHEFIKKTDVLFITLGTANAFELTQDGTIVANCHKFPNDKFNRKELSIDEMILALKTVIASILKINPKVKVVFTVSPVRHVRDGLVENQLSKAKLICSVHQLSRTNESVFYFPSYELIVDDLRDYRFYSSDMLHVNDVGLHYIWDYFKQSFFSDNTISLTERILSIQKDLSHKPFYPKSDKHQQFLTKLLKKINKLESENSMLDFSKDKEMINLQIDS